MYSTENIFTLGKKFFIFCRQPLERNAIIIIERGNILGGELGDWGVFSRKRVRFGAS